KAWQFIKFMASPQAAKVRAIKGGFLSPLKASYEDKQLVSQVPTIALARQIRDQIRPRPVSPFYSDISLKMQEAFNNNLKGETSPSETTSALEQQIKTIVQEGTG
ncbi:MAG TPA: ABC transporter substrate-binding protein, partial [Actinomycetota bacterium]|nr:ABC transporter substrate-binding protein [Actinomycetota bacterium]